MSKHGKDIKRVPASRCLNCGLSMNALGTGSSDVAAAPKEGDVAVCIKCGAVMKLDKNLRLRGMTDAEMDELVADHEWMNNVARLVRHVHFLKHMKG